MFDFIFIRLTNTGYQVVVIVQITSSRDVLRLPPASALTLLELVKVAVVFVAITAGYDFNAFFPPEVIAIAPVMLLLKINEVA